MRVEVNQRNDKFGLMPTVTTEFFGGGGGGGGRDYNSTISGQSCTTFSGAFSALGAGALVGAVGGAITGPGALLGAIAGAASAGVGHEVGCLQADVRGPNR